MRAYVDTGKELVVVEATEVVYDKKDSQLIVKTNPVSRLTVGMPLTEAKQYLTTLAEKGFAFIHRDDCKVQGSML